jgi:hypothetical protein
MSGDDLFSPPRVFSESREIYFAAIDGISRGFK